MSAEAEKKEKEGELPEIPLDYISIGISTLAVLIAGGLGISWWLSDQKNTNERKQRIAERKRMEEYRRQWEEQLWREQNPDPGLSSTIDRSTALQSSSTPMMTAADGHKMTGGVLDTGEGVNEYGNYGNYGNEEEYVGSSAPPNNVSGYREPMPTHEHQPRIKSPPPKPIGNKITRVMSMDENDNYPLSQEQRQYRPNVQDGSEADDLSDIV